MPSHLRPCPSCARHVRVNESGCPFCGASLAGAFLGDRASTSPTARLSRAALFALGTGTAAVGAGALIEACDEPMTISDYGASPFDPNNPFDAAVFEDAARSNDAGASDAAGTDAGGSSDSGDADAASTPSDAEGDATGDSSDSAVPDAD